MDLPLFPRLQSIVLYPQDPALIHPLLTSLLSCYRLLYTNTSPFAHCSPT